MSSSLNIVLIVGSAPDALTIKDQDLSLFSSRVVINNAWQLIKDWDYLIYPEDFPNKHLPSDTVLAKKKIVTAREFVPEQNFFGGFVYGGGTMAFTAGYWALGVLKPDVIAYLGCDMIYPSEKSRASHFYGNGQADPLRSDITLQSLEAKSVRLMALAQIHNCSVVNLSKLSESRLLFPRTSITKLLKEIEQKNSLCLQDIKLDSKSVKRALDLEEELAYMVPSGRYWESLGEFNQFKLSEIDSLWLKSVSRRELY
ncbi:MAG: hypothetical protein EXR13_05245 [Candidatus Fonsibacter sp.]|nr:hypothetical protein [Candidatus Fonsibacter sp.]